MQSDAALTQSLDPSVPPRQIYIYESVMSLLTRLAMTAQGAAALLDAGLTACLSDCSVLDARPNIPSFRFVLEQSRPPRTSLL